MKSKNYIYFVLTGIALMLSLFFFSSRIWMGDDRAEKDMNYGQSVSVAGVWDIKVTNARYDKEKRLLELEYYSKIRNGSTSAPPEIRAVLSKAVSEPVYLKIVDMLDNPNGQYIQISNMPESWYYIKLQFTAERSAGETREPVTDKFGALQTQPDIQSDRKETRTVQIDYRMCMETKLEVKSGSHVSIEPTGTSPAGTVPDTTFSRLDELGRQADQLKGQIYDKNQELSKLQAQLEASINQKSTLEKEAADGTNPSQSEIDALNVRISEMNSNISGIQTEIRTLESKLKDLQEQINGGR